MSCANAIVVANNYCVAVKAPPAEVVQKLSEVKTEPAKAWVVNFNQLLKAWENKRICAQLTYLD